MKHRIIGAIISAILIFSFSNVARAQTVAYALTSASFVSIGTASYYLQSTGPSPTVLVIATSTPTAGTTGTLLIPGGPAIQITPAAGETVYVSSLGATSNCVATTVGIPSVSVSNGVQGTTVGGAVPSGNNVLVQKPSPVAPIAGAQFGLSVNSSTSLTVPSGTLYVVICTETIAVRWRDDGTAPTAAVGMPLPANQCMTYNGTASAIKFIGVSSGATIDASYYD